jgi:hypothetical protein
VTRILTDTSWFQCNGLKPCHTCVRRKLICSYTTNAAEHGTGESAGSPTKRRHIETSPPSISATLETASSSPANYASHESKQLWDEVRDGELVKDESSASTSTSTPTVPPQLPSSSSHMHVRRTSSHEFNNQAGRDNMHGQAEEATIYTETRMLQDQTGRLRGFSRCPRHVPVPHLT